jgi:hypothetical protein
MDTFVVISGNTGVKRFMIGSYRQIYKMYVITPFSGIGCDGGEEDSFGRYPKKVSYESIHWIQKPQTI